MAAWVYALLCGAGGGAHARYRAARRRWRRRVLRLSWPVALLLGAGTVLVAVVGRHPVLTLTAVALGSVLGSYLMLLQSPPAYVERWQEGADGERRTARALAGARRDGAIVIHDVPDRGLPDGRRGNLDHVVVSRRGLFVIDSKWLGGEASVEGEVVRLQRREDPELRCEITAYGPAVRGQAARLHADLAADGQAPFVKALVVFWNRFDQRIIAGDRVTYLHGTELRRWLGEQPEILTDQLVRDLARRVQAHRGRARLSLLERLRGRLPGWDSAATRPGSGGETPASCP